MFVPRIVASGGKGVVLSQFTLSVRPSQFRCSVLSNTVSFAHATNYERVAIGQSRTVYYTARLVRALFSALIKSAPLGRSYM